MERETLGLRGRASEDLRIDTHCVRGWLLTVRVADVFDVSLRLLLLRAAALAATAGEVHLDPVRSTWPKGKLSEPQNLSYACRPISAYSHGPELSASIL